MKRLVTLMLICNTIAVASQNFCPENDSCLGSIETFACTPVYYCNTTCNFEFYNSNPEIDNSAGPWDTPCHYINYDQWFEFTYPATSSGYLTLDIWGGDCAHPDGEVGSHGPLEGWTMLVYQNETCAEADLVFSTSCYWMTESDSPEVIGQDDWIGIEDFDPTRQEWYITITNAIAGQHYFVQIDGFGWCQGCGWFQWCDEVMFLALVPETPVISTLEETDNVLIDVIKITNLLGQETGVIYNVPLIFYYKYSHPRIVVMSE